MAVRVRPYFAIVAMLAISGSAAATEFPICGSGPRINCVVDGDTVWHEGIKYRFPEIDTPEKGQLAECMQEGLQAIEATKRLAEILSTHEFTIEPEGKDRYGRVLARFVIGNTTAGEMLVAEGLAMPWTGRRYDGWCSSGGGFPPSVRLAANWLEHVWDEPCGDRPSPHSRHLDIAKTMSRTLSFD